MTHDVEFEQWANKVWDYNNAQAGPDTRQQEVSLADFRKDITIDVFNEAGQKVLAYQVFRCWVSEYQSISDLDANANAVAIQHIKLENEGWVRDLTRSRAHGTDLQRPAGVTDAATTVTQRTSSTPGNAGFASRPPGRRWSCWRRPQRIWPPRPWRE